MNKATTKPPVAKKSLIVSASRLANEFGHDNETEAMAYHALEVLAAENEDAIFPYVVGGYVSAATNGGFALATNQPKPQDVEAFRALDDQLAAFGAEPQEIIYFDLTDFL